MLKSVSAQTYRHALSIFHITIWTKMQREAASERGDVIRPGPHLYEIEIDGGQQREQRLPTLK